MKKEYHHLTLEERERLFGYKKQSLSLHSIARKLERSVGTISRELKRNAPYGQTYIPCIAEGRSVKRARRQRSQASWKGSEIYLYVRRMLREEQWSPEIIAGRLSVIHPGLSICHETIYRAIYDRENRKDRLWQYLTVKRQKRMRKGGRRINRNSRIPEAVSIDKRPSAVNGRRQIGHWETDNVIGKITDKTAFSNGKNPFLYNIPRFSYTKLANSLGITTFAIHFNPESNKKELRNPQSLFKSALTNALTVFGPVLVELILPSAPEAWKGIWAIKGNENK